jgi:hypothetical protein
MTFSEYENLPLAALQAEFLRLAQIYVDAANRRQYLIELIHKRKVEASARVRLSVLSRDDKDALRLVLEEAA